MLHSIYLDRMNVQIQDYVKKTYAFTLDEQVKDPEQVFISTRKEDLLLLLMLRGFRKLDALLENRTKDIIFKQVPQIGHKYYIGYYFTCEVII